MLFCLSARRRFRTSVSGAGAPLTKPSGMSGRCSRTSMLRKEGLPETPATNQANTIRLVRILVGKTCCGLLKPQLRKWQLYIIDTRRCMNWYFGSTHNLYAWCITIRATAERDILRCILPRVSYLTMRWPRGNTTCIAVLKAVKWDVISRSQTREKLAGVGLRFDVTVSQLLTEIFLEKTFLYHVWWPMRFHLFWVHRTLYIDSLQPHLDQYFWLLIG